CPGDFGSTPTVITWLFIPRSDLKHPSCFHCHISLAELLAPNILLCGEGLTHNAHPFAQSKRGTPLFSGLQCLINHAAALLVGSEPPGVFLLPLRVNCCTGLLPDRFFAFPSAPERRDQSVIPRHHQPFPFPYPL